MPGVAKRDAWAGMCLQRAHLDYVRTHPSQTALHHARAHHTMGMDHTATRIRTERQSGACRVSVLERLRSLACRLIYVAAADPTP
eukprot:5521408-Prymnesium_polylepis.1